MASSRINAERLARAVQSLHGLNCGDCFGERFFLHPEVAQSLIAQRAVPSKPWRYTDDTAMAISIVEILEELGEVDPNDLQRTSADALSPILDVATVMPCTRCSRS